MPTPPTALNRCQRAVELVEECLRQGCVPQGMGGGRSAVRAALPRAKAEGVANTEGGFHGVLRAARELHGLEPDWSMYRPKVYLHRPPGAPVIPFQDHVQEDDPEGEPIRVAIIGDAHDSPHLADKSRFVWLGRYCAERKVERIISVGDWMTMDCFSTHLDRATFEGLAKPTFAQDMESFHASQRAFRQGLGAHKPKLDVTLGNHCHRAWRWDDLHPESVSHGRLVDEAFAQ